MRKSEILNQLKRKIELCRRFNNAAHGVLNQIEDLFDKFDRAEDQIQQHTEAEGEIAMHEAYEMVMQQNYDNY